MAQACISPLISSGIQPASKMFVFDVSTSTLAKVQKEYDIQTAQTLGELVKDADIIICAVKPQNLTPQFFAETSTNPNATLLSVVAGKPIKAFRDGGFRKVARSMPNTPAQIGRGMTVWSCTENISTTERDKIQKILGAMGKTVCPTCVCCVRVKCWNNRLKRFISLSVCLPYRRFSWTMRTLLTCRLVYRVVDRLTFSCLWRQ